jgi:hypothetical protein
MVAEGLRDRMLAHLLHLQQRLHEVVHIAQAAS